MYIGWTSYTCPSCSAHIESRIVSSPRVGPERKACSRCGFSYRTPDLEWRNMNTSKRLGYFLSEWTVGWLGFFALAGFLLVQETPHWLGALEGLGIGMACCTPLWLWKVRKVKQSLQRAT
jgi:hypothetical protein